jgi:signal transduction histidine kinase
MKLEAEIDVLNQRLLALEAENKRLKLIEGELLETNATKDKFLAIISHDLRNPINTVVGLSEMLEKQIEKNNFQSVAEYAKYIKQSTHKIKGLLLNLLEWSISQSGKMEFNPTKNRFTSIIAEVLELFEEMLKQKQLTVEYKCNCLENEHVIIDKEMISSVVRNFITNAIKFSYPEGKITISCEDSNESIVFRITDNGMGMTPATLNGLFKFGELIPNEGTNNEKGTGLGLLLCKEFIEKHQGEIVVESEVGKGSTFKFLLPVVKNLHETELEFH